jgi:hypothetical protein
MKMIDYITPDQRISAPPPTLDQKRAQAVAYLRLPVLMRRQA